MSDIKIKKTVKGTIKTIDKDVKQIQRAKDRTRNKINSAEDEFDTFGTNYAIDNITEKTYSMPNKIKQANRYGKNSFNETKENIIKTKHKIDNYKIKRNTSKAKRRAMKNTTKQTVKTAEQTGKTTIKTAEKTGKYAKDTAKATIKASQKAYQLAKETAIKIAKGVKALAKATVKVVKAIATGIKALASAIVAGGWIAVLIIVGLCLVSFILFSVFGTNDDEYIDNPSSNYQLVMIAKAQLGNNGGEKFWSWYGFNERVEWCACFVSWCADQNGDIEKGNIPRFSVCGDGINWFKERNRYFEREELYLPKAGDIIFFDWFDKDTGLQDGISDHVGIVEKIDIESQTVYTIEGNSGDSCKENTYDINNVQIMGYGISKLEMIEN